MSPSPFWVKIALAPPGSGSVATAPLVILCSCLSAERISNEIFFSSNAVGCAPSPVVAPAASCPAGTTPLVSTPAVPPAGGFALGCPATLTLSPLGVLIGLATFAAPPVSPFASSSACASSCSNCCASIFACCGGTPASISSCVICSTRFLGMLTAAALFSALIASATLRAAIFLAVSKGVPNAISRSYSS